MKLKHFDVLTKLTKNYYEFIKKNDDDFSYLKGQYFGTIRRNLNKNIIEKKFYGFCKSVKTVYVYDSRTSETSIQLVINYILSDRRGGQIRLNLNNIGHYIFDIIHGDDPDSVKLEMELDE